MASSYTSSYNLCQWKPSDKVLRAEFNADNVKIDAALAGKAEQSEVSLLKSAVECKAEQSALDRLSAAVSGHGTALEARNCRVYFTTYSGDGAESRTFTFPSKPWLVIFFRSDEVLTMAVRDNSCPFSFGNTSVSSSFKWSDTSVSAQKAFALVNSKNMSYSLLAFLEI